MNIKEYFEKHNQNTLSSEEWEQLAQTLITAKFDREKSNQWALKLNVLGVYRTVAGKRNTNLSIVHIRKYLAAASILLVMFASVWYFFLRSPLTADQQMASHYLERPFQINQGTRGPEFMEQNRGKALKSYEEKEYEQALTYLSIIESSGQANARDYFQIGLCFMYQKQPDYDKALSAFAAAQKTDSAVYPDEINWFTGLCYVMKKDEQSAAKYLQKVVDSPASRDRDAAMELLRKMKQTN